MPEHLFLYGTLLPELAPEPLRDSLRQLRLVGPGSLRGRLVDLGDYPGAILDPKAAGFIRGQVFGMAQLPATLAALDAYEGFDHTDPAGSLFLRQAQPVTLDGGGCMRCWMYVYNRDPAGMPLVPDGDYRAWLKRASGDPV
jgi:gamma-glutamylcyclotransferase (GGCT)/AIG2-like uncharacterized protein YtfP